MSRTVPARPVGPPLDGPSQAFDLKDVLWRMRRYSWLLVLPVVTCLCVAAIYARHVQPIYQAYLVVSVDDPADVSAGLRQYVQGQSPGGGPREKITLVDGMIHNQTFLRAVAERMGMDKDPAFLNRATAAAKATPGITPAEYALRLAVGQLWTKISVSAGRGAAIQIVVKDPSPEYARDMAAVIGDVLQQQNLQAALERAQARGELSKDQVAVYEEKVRQAENALRSFQESHLHSTITAGISTDADLQLAQSLSRSTDDEIDQLRLRIKSGDDEWHTLAGDQTMPVLSSTRSNELANTLVKLEQSAAMSQLNPKSGTTGEADAVRNKVTATRQALFLEFDRLAAGIDGVPPEARTTASGVALDRVVLRSLQARNDQFASVSRNYLSNLARSPRDAMELQTLQDNLTQARNVLLTFRNEAASSRISEAIATSQVGPRLEILEHPLLPLQPSSLGPQTTYALAIFLGLVIDAVIVFAGERLAAVIRTVEQAEQEYGLRVVGVVPRILHRPKPGGYLKNNWPKFAIVAVLVVTVLVVVVEVTVFPPAVKTTTQSQK